MQLHLRRPFGSPVVASPGHLARFGLSRRHSPSTAVDRWGLRRLLARVDDVPLEVALWDGARANTAAAPAAYRLVLHSRAALWRLLRDPDLGFGEGYTRGEIEVEGDFRSLVEAVARSLARRHWSGGRWRQWLDGVTGASPGRARHNAQWHYDLGNDFYRLWLDEDLVYTCAYFPTPDASLEVAQRAKLEHVCRKVFLSPGTRVFEAGSGWGALACHMAREHGAIVDAWNVSHEQVVAARARAEAEGLADRVRFIEDDWRRMAGQCDVFVSIGMLEHVGLARYRQLGEVIHRVLHPTRGRGLLHFIGRNVEAPASRWTRRYIFPGTYLPTLRQVLTHVIEPYGFSVVDVENLRRHYTLTLEHWLARFERAAPAIASRYGEPFVRMWRYYLAGARAGFAAGHLQLFQVAFVRAGHDGGPWRRPA